ncbi:MAG: DUF5714 domain-containing protein [Desulfomonilaceae bacterium]|nr:DUF5714 domain-containing protein [Desulfomonilaceae bacterium]
MGRFHRINRGLHTVYLNPEIPFWFVPSPSGDKLLTELGNGPCRDDRMDNFMRPDGNNWNGDYDISTLLRSISVPRIPAHGGRKERNPEALSELWFHLTDACNCRCSHCLFGDRSRPAGTLPPERVMTLVEEGYELGVRLVCFTGGEPFMYPDFPDLLRRLLKRADLRIAVLTNGLLVPGVLQELSSLDVKRLHFQVSLDGPEAMHDSIRGRGTFRKACEALTSMTEHSLPNSVAMAVHNKNVEGMSELIGVVQELGVGTVHFMWHFNRGSGKALSTLQLPTLVENFRAAAAAARNIGVVIDNIEAIKAQVFSHPGTRFDLGNAGWESIAIGPDESVYPTPAMVDLPRFRGGSARRGIEKVWRDGAMLRSIRNASLIDIPEMKDDPWRLIIGGGDLDHCVELNGDAREALTLRDDPYRPLYREIALLAIEEALEGLPVPPHPGMILRMGDITTDCPSSKDVNFTHCNCLLSMGEGSTRGLVRKFYTDRAATPDEIILNPIQWQDGELAFIPDEAKARMYGCGSPIAEAGLKKGETLVDLGSGTGVECFLAAREVGALGRAIGIDMTDAMLDIARRSQEHVRRQLGYENTEFRKGFLEAVPLKDSTADVIISNCVVNLSHDKRRVFSEILRVLKPGGRLVISDVVAEEDPPLTVRGDHQLIGECIGGALVQDYLFSLLRDVGFVNADIIKRFPYREIQGHRFYSLTFRAYKPSAEERTRLVYAGPFKAVITDDGRILPKGLPLEVNLGPGWDGDRPARAGVFTLDERSGEVTNVEAESSCTCFIPPSTGEPPVPESKPETGCLICGAPLIYRDRNETVTCAICGWIGQARAQCADGHYVCDHCHTREPLEITKRLCLSSHDTDMFTLFYRITSHPTIPLHGPEYHGVVPGVVLSTYRNLGGTITDDRILEGIDRGALVPGGSCAFLGVCGAASGIGIAFSIMLDANPLKSGPRQHVQRIVSAALAEISSYKAARCCRREAHLSFQVAARESVGLLGKELRAEQWLSCGQHDLNKECIKRRCSFYKRLQRSLTAMG